MNPTISTSDNSPDRLSINELLGEETALKMQLNRYGLTKDFNNVIQFLTIFLTKLFSQDSSLEKIIEEIQNIKLYRARDIYIQNKTEFEKLEDTIPMLRERIDKLENIFGSLKSTCSTHSKDFLIKRLLYVIEQVQDILNGYLFPLGINTSTNQQVIDTIEQ